MQSYEVVRNEQARPFEQSLGRLREASTLLRQRAERDGDGLSRLRQAIRELEGRKGALAAPREAIEKDIASLQQRIRELEQEIASRKGLLQEHMRQQDEIDGTVKERRLELRQLEKQIGDAENELEANDAEIQSTQERLRRAHVQALRLYLDGAFRVLQDAGKTRVAQAAYDSLKREYEHTQKRDADLAHLEAERREIVELLKSAQVPTLRTLLEERLRNAEERVEARFPGLLAGPPRTDEEYIDLFHWYDEHDDVTRVVLPLPVAMWDQPPDRAGDPTGTTMCKVLWTIVSPIASTAVPSIDKVDDFLVLEFHGDLRSPLGDDFIEFADGPGCGVRFLATALPAEIAATIGG